MSRMPRRRSTTGLAGLVLTAGLLAGCQDDEPGGAVSTESAGDGVSCNGQAIAPPLPADALVGTWGYQDSHLFEDGEDYRADVRGLLTIGEDGRWDGDRETVSGDGSFSYPIAYGPGDWTFDSRTLTLAYDDGSDSDTFTGVRVSDQVTAEGAPIRAMTLEYADATGCTTYLLFAQR